jgi:hypothetical protein
MLDELLELQEVVFVLRVVLSPQRLVAGESTNAALGVPVRYREEVRNRVLVSAQHRDAEIAWNRAIVRNGPPLEKTSIGVRF